MFVTSRTNQDDNNGIAVMLKTNHEVRQLKLKYKSLSNHNTLATANKFQLQGVQHESDPNADAKTDTPFCVNQLVSILHFPVSPPEPKKLTQK